MELEVNCVKGLFWLKADLKCLGVSLSAISEIDRNIDSQWTVLDLLNAWVEMQRKEFRVLIRRILRTNDNFFHQFDLQHKFMCLKLLNFFSEVLLLVLRFCSSGVLELKIDHEEFIRAD